MPTTQEELEIRLADILIREDKLNDWEARFIDSITIQIEDEAGLSERQDESFTRVWERLTWEGLTS